MKKETKPFVTMDENANYCVIIDVDNLKQAEIALREAEIEWYGKNHTEESIPIEDFYEADIYYGKHDGEEVYYWGDKPKEFFEGEYETEKGFVAGLD